MSQSLRSVDTLCRFLQALFAKLEAESVRYLVLHAYEGLPEHVDSDIDFLVHPGCITSFQQCVLLTARTNGWLLIKNPSRFGFRSLWLKSSVSHEFVQIDVWSVIHWKSVPWIDTETMLRGKRRFGPLYVPSATAEAGYLLVKDVLESGEIKRKYLGIIRQVAQEKSESLEKVLEWGFGRETATSLVRQAAIDVPVPLDGFCRVLRKSAVIQSIRRNPFILFRNLLLFLLNHLRARVRPNGFFLVLIGPDGAGKSTASGELSKRLAPAFRKQVYFHGRFGFLPDLRVFLNIARRLSGRKVLPPAPSGPHAIQDVPAHGLIRCLLHIAYYSLDFLLGYLPLARANAIGSLIIFDRYYYDWFIQRYFRRTPRCLLKIMIVTLPKPDLVVYLENSPETIHRRKAELTVEQIAEQAYRCREIVRSMPYGMTVSTEQSPQEVSRKIADRVVSIMTNRYPQVVRH